MADNANRIDKPGGSALAQTIVVVVALVASVLLVVFLQDALQLDETSTLLVGVIVIVVAVFLVTYLLILLRRLRIRAYWQQTCQPILVRYHESHDPRQLMDDYTSWLHRGLEPKLVYDFTKATVEEFIEGGSYAYARKQLKAMAQMPANDRTRAEFEQFRSSCDDRMRAGKKSSR